MIIKLTKSGILLRREGLKGYGFTSKLFLRNVLKADANGEFVHYQLGYGIELTRWNFKHPIQTLKSVFKLLTHP